MKNASKSLLKNTTILTFGLLCTKGIMFIMTPLFTKWMSQNDYGTFDILLGYVTLIIPLVTIDMGEALFRFLIGQQNKETDIIISTAFVVFLAGTFIFTSFMLAFIFIGAQELEIVSAFCIAVIMEIAYTFLTMVSRGLKKLKEFTIANLIYILCMVVASIVLVRNLHMSVVGLLLSHSLGYLVACVFMTINTKIISHIHFRKFSIETFKHMARYSLPLIPNVVGWWIISISDRTIVSYFLGFESNAILSVSHKVPNLCQTLFSRFHLSWAQSAAETIDSAERDEFYHSVFNKLIQITCSGVSLLCSVNYFFFLLYSKEYFGGYYITPVLFVAIVIYICSQFLGGIHNAMLKTKINGKTTALGAGVNLLVHILLVRYIGLFAAVLSSLMAYTVIFAIRYKYTRSDAQLHISSASVFSFVMMLFFALSNYILPEQLVVRIMVLILCLIIILLVNRKNMNTIITWIKKKYFSRICKEKQK